LDSQAQRRPATVRPRGERAACLEAREALHRYNYDRRGRGDFFEKAAVAIAASIPQAERRIIAGQTHMVDPKALAPELEQFFRR